MLLHPVRYIYNAIEDVCKFYQLNPSDSYYKYCFFISIFL